MSTAPVCKRMRPPDFIRHTSRGAGGGGARLAEWEEPLLAGIEVAHVLGHGDARHGHARKHADALRDVNERELLRRRHDDRRVERHALTQRQLNVTCTQPDALV